ncbi:MAG TPA: polysaccharide biosynthesis/export family protein [Chryseosolibacter sp.]
MFKTDGYAGLEKERQTAESNYVIQKNDVLSLEIYTNQGQRIIDPNYESLKESPGQPARAEQPTYLVDKDGIAKLPFLQEIKLEGLTLRQAEEILQKEYTKLYQEPFVVLKITNKRVTVLGAPGGKVIPLLNENVNLAEVLALAGGINRDGKATNIRVLRGKQIFVANFSTVEGYLRDNILIHSGDIIYVEPVRKPFFEGLQDYGALFGIITSIGTLTLLILRTN